MSITNFMVMFIVVISMEYRMQRDLRQEQSHKQRKGNGGIFMKIHERKGSNCKTCR
jgi:hypothetical protein